MKIERVKEIITPKENINSMLIGILCVTGLISFITGINNIIPIIIIMVLAIIEIVNYKETLAKLKKRELLMPNGFLIFILFINILYLMSYLRNGVKYTTIDRLFHFIGFLIIPAICCRHKITAKGIVNSILILSGIMAIPMFFINFGKYDGGMRMSIIYYMLPTYISMIMSFFVTENKNKKSIFIKLLIYFILFYPYISFLLLHASRGIFIAIAICLYLCLIAKRKVKVKIIITVVILIIGVIGIVFFKPILTVANDIFINMNIHIEAISKNLKLYEEGKLGNGREKVYAWASEGIKEHPWIGNGIGEYADRYGTYPHNLLLQAWYEGGIIFFSLMLYFLGYSVYVFIFDKKTDDNKKYILILFFSISIIRLMLSYEFWKEISFGLYLYIIIDIMQSNFIRRKSLKDGKCNNTNV